MFCLSVILLVLLSHSTIFQRCVKEICMARSSHLTATTCINIGGYYRMSNSVDDCYYNQFNCKFQLVDGQCYAFKTPTNDETECGLKAGYYKHGYCYHECPNDKFLTKGKCYDTRSTQYTQSDCEEVGGHYEHKFCYLEGCNYTWINSVCYKKRSAFYSKGTCINIGGHYASSTCYYTSFNCRLHQVNGQCYSRSSNRSQTSCQLIPDSYFDTNDNTCYYYCTELFWTGKCFVADNPKFTRNTCATIGGTYDDGGNTCYYITSHCPVYPANNGQCYTNRSDAFTCDTCRNIGGHHENGYCYYYEYNCNNYNIGGQCYSKRTPMVTTYSCTKRNGKLSGSSTSYCYYDSTKCGNLWYRNCLCFRYADSGYKTAGTCDNIGGYYNIREGRCYYNSSSCRYIYRNGQCYKYKDVNFPREECLAIGGYSTYGSSGSVCYYNELNCSRWINKKCYLRFSQSYNKGTCATIGGSYSLEEKGCYYNLTQNCRYFYRQCYDRYYSGWSHTQCRDAKGYYRYTRLCYISDYYCPRVLTSVKKCYSFISESYDCSSCKLLGGFLYSGRCYYQTTNCSAPLYPANNGQCYRNQTTRKTADSCSSISGHSFYDNRDSKCYFTLESCLSGRYVNCECFLHSSTIYTAGSCNNFGGQYLNGTCYYNSSFCSVRNYAVNGQCYQRRMLYSSRKLCLNINGYFLPLSGRPTTIPPFFTDYPYGTTTPSTTTNDGRTNSGSSTHGTCYYNTYHCTGYTVNRYFCYTNRSMTYGMATCRNIGGMYAYRLNDTTYQTSGSLIYNSRTYHCLYNTFDCAGYAVKDECHLYMSTNFSSDTCKHIEGTYIAANHTCYYHRYRCIYYDVGGQCYRYRSCGQRSCETCRVSGGYYKSSNKCCYYNRSNCKYFIDGECYENTTTLYNSSACASVRNGYFLKGLCYYNAPPNCAAGYYHQCVCYPQRSANYSNETCINTNGFHKDGYCYYEAFNCPWFSINGQCYRRISTRMTPDTCDNIGGYFYAESSDSTNATSSANGTTPTNACYYSNFNCPTVRAYGGQCYSARSTAKSCPSCNNIGGTYKGSSNVCYYYSNDCKYRSAGQQCHTDRTRSYNATTCQQMDGYQHSDGYCYYTPNDCSSSYQYYINCQCYRQSSSLYTDATCINIRGGYSFAQRRCYYNFTSYCNRYWVRSQCYNRRRYAYSSYSCRRSEVYYGRYCYYNRF